jgi:hypothetical protein
MTAACALWISILFAMGLALFVLVFLLIRLRLPWHPEAIVLVTVGAALAYLVVVVLLSVLAWQGCG